MGGTESCKEKPCTQISRPRLLCRALVSSVSGSDLKEIVKFRILNDGLGESWILPFYTVP